MKIIIESIPHENQRYPTVGDWFTDPDGTLQIRVSKMSDPRYEQLVAVHELVEVLMCQQAGITQEAVDAFDKAFESNRPEGNEDEPGDDPKAPYRKQHGIATGIESILAAEMDVVWPNYEDEINSLP